MVKKNIAKYARNKAPLTPHSCHYFVLLNFRTSAALVDVEACFIVPLVCIFGTVNKVKHVLKCLQAFMCPLH